MHNSQFKVSKNTSNALVNVATVLVNVQSIEVDTTKLPNKEVCRDCSCAKCLSPPLPSSLYFFFFFIFFLSPFLPPLLHSSQPQAAEIMKVFYEQTTSGISYKKSYPFSLSPFPLLPFFSPPFFLFPFFLPLLKVIRDVKEQKMKAVN